MRTGLALLLALTLLLAVGSTAATTPNVRGVVVRATGAGGCYPGEPCDQPPAAAYVVFSRAGRLTRARLAASGAFALHLAAGVYAVSTAPPRGSLAPATVRVPRVGIVRPRLVQRIG